MSVCFELKISPLEAQQMYFDDADYLGLIGYYNEIKKATAALEKK